MDRRTNAHGVESTVVSRRAMPVSRSGGVQEDGVQGPGLKAGGTKLCSLFAVASGRALPMPVSSSPLHAQPRLSPRSPGNPLCNGVRPLTRICPCHPDHLPRRLCVPSSPHHNTEGTVLGVGLERPPQTISFLRVGPCPLWLADEDPRSRRSLNLC